MDSQVPVNRSDAQLWFQRCALLLAALCLALLLVSCHRWPVPAAVPFPDDPRVLHGEWDVHVTGVRNGVGSFVLTPDAQKLILWINGTVQAYTADDAGGWAEADAAAFTGPGLARYDATIAAFVTIRIDGAASGVSVLPLTGGAAVKNTIAFPAGWSPLGTVIGSGRSFVLAQPASGGPKLFWWDSLTGDFGGQLDIPHMRDGMRVSANGSIISFWDLGSYGVRVLSTADPARLHTVRLGICRSNGLSEGSADGRWFVFSDCSGNLHVTDLANPAAGSSPLGFKQDSVLRFAADSPELVWLDAAGRIHSYNVESAARQVIFTLSGAKPSEKFHPYYTATYLNRNADLLAVITGSGQLRLQRLSETTQFTHLPALELSRGTLLLTASDVQRDARSSGYTVTGTLEIAGELLEAAGAVYSHGLHDYHPTALETQAPPPPDMRGSITISDPHTDEETMLLTFHSRDGAATSYEGTLSLHASDKTFAVELQRSSITR